MEESPISDSTMLLILISVYFILLFSKDQKFWMPADWDSFIKYIKTAYLEI